MQIEEIGAKKDKGPQFEYTQRGEEVRRLAQSMGAERQASAHAAQLNSGQNGARGQIDSSSLSTEAVNGTGALSLTQKTRTTQILTGLEQSFQSNTQDRDQRHRLPVQPKRD